MFSACMLVHAQSGHVSSVMWHVCSLKKRKVALIQVVLSQLQLHYQTMCMQTNQLHLETG